MNRHITFKVYFCLYCIVALIILESKYISFFSGGSSEMQSSFPWEIMAISLGSVGFILASLAVVYALRRKLGILRWDVYCSAVELNVFAYYDD